MFPLGHGPSIIMKLSSQTRLTNVGRFGQVQVTDSELASGQAPWSESTSPQATYSECSVANGIPSAKLHPSDRRMKASRCH